jgi:hypothetical protein
VAFVKLLDLDIYYLSMKEERKYAIMMTNYSSIRRKELGKSSLILLRQGDAYKPWAMNLLDYRRLKGKGSKYHF